MAFNLRYFKLFKYLFPKSKYFMLYIQKKLTQSIEGLTSIPDDFRKYIDNIFNDLFPFKTRAIELWEKVLGLINYSNNDDIRRQIIDNRWKMKGGQSNNYIQKILQDAGFDVQVHENNPPVDPSLLITENQLLVNGRIVLSIPKKIISRAGNVFAGNNRSFAGYYEEFLPPEIKTYDFPESSLLNPFIFFIGGDVTRNPTTHEIINIEFAYIEIEKLKEFITLILKLKPVHAWAGLIIQVITEQQLYFNDDKMVELYDDSLLQVRTGSDLDLYS